MNAIFNPKDSETIEYCHVCGSLGRPLYTGLQDRLFNTPGYWPMLRCPQDHQLWLKSRPKAENISQVYDTYYTHTTSCSKVGRSSSFGNIRELAVKWALSNCFGYSPPAKLTVLPRLAGLFLSAIPWAREFLAYEVMWLHSCPGGTILDIGCGEGTFLARMESLGWTGFGIEVDSISVQMAKAKVRVPENILLGTLRSADYPSNSFDAVTMHHVIEHIHEPQATLKEALRLLKPGGKLVVTTPNSKAFGHRIFRSDWRGLEPPRHLQLFCPSTLGSTVTNAGFSIDRIRTSARSAWEIWSASRIISQSGLQTKRAVVRFNHFLRLEGMLFQILEYCLLAIIRDIGEAIALFAHKSELGDLRNDSNSGGP